MIRQAEAVVEETPSVVRNGKATCATCGAVGVMCSPGPLPRHLDRVACHAQMQINRIAFAHGRVRIGGRR